MPSTFTQNLGLEQPATGEQAGAWGTTVNFNYDILDAAIDGNVTIALAGSPYQLQTGITGAGPPEQGVNEVIICTGSQSATGVVQITPNSVQKVYIFQNHTTGGFGVTIQQGGGSNFTLQPGYSAIVYSDGGGGSANVSAALDSPQFQNLLLTGNAVVQGSLTLQGSLIFSGTGVVHIDQNVGIGIGMAPTHSLIIGDAATPEMWLDTQNSTQQTRQVVWSSNGQPRWALQTVIAAEAGGNTGSDLQLASFVDSGNPNRIQLFLSRASGNVTIGAGSDQLARLAVIGDNSGQTTLGVKAAASQTVPVLLCQNSAGQNLAVVDNSGNVRIVGDYIVQQGPTLYTGQSVTVNVLGPGGTTHALGFVGGILVSVQ